MAYTPQIYYPAGYQYAMNYPQPAQIPQQAPQPTLQQNQGLNWVQGESGAKAYLMVPNSTVMLMDSEDSVFYLKSTDSSGMPTLRTFDYKERTQNIQTSTPQAPQSEQKPLNEQFVTREEYNAICGKYDELKSMLAELQKAKVPRGKEKLSDE